MTPLSAPESSETALDQRADRLRMLRHQIEHASHFLPAQGPITVFVHHNTLHYYEDLPFEQAVEEGARRHGHQPYLSEERFRSELERGRITLSDLEHELRATLDSDGEHRIAGLCTRFELRRAMLQYQSQMAPAAELRWLVAESNALRQFRVDAPAATRSRMIEQTRHWVLRDLHVNGSATSGETDPAIVRTRAVVASLFQRLGADKIERWPDGTWEAFTLQTLWRLCHQGVHGVEPAEPAAASSVRRHRSLLLEAGGVDTDRDVNELLIRYCASFLDQGFARWPLPGRERGFFRAFLELYSVGGGFPEAWQRGLKSETRRLIRENVSPLESIDESLELLGVPPQEREEYLTQTLLALPGWGGMIQQLETAVDWALHPVSEGTLCEFVAIRLLLDRIAIANAMRDAFNYRGTLAGARAELRSRLTRHEHANVDQRAFVLFQLAQVMGWLPETLSRLNKSEWAELLREAEGFSSVERRRMFQLAYERNYYCHALDAMGLNRPAKRPNGQPPSFQIMCCIDDREESFRRHLEEIDPRCETFSAAGFFAVAMNYRGVGDAHSLPLCPVVIKPTHHVVEDVYYSLEQINRRRQDARRRLGNASLRWHTGSRTFLGGILTGILGSLATFPLVARILFPRLTSQIRQLFGQLVQPPQLTQLHLERTADPPGRENGHVGYTVAEMAGIVERILRDLGLAHGFSRLFIATGHGSSSLNNPHESAYNCGACSGGRGGPNARAFAQMANDPRVRGILATRGLVIPAETHFVGAYHNTCDDSLTYFDLDRVPMSHRADFERAKQTIDEARERNAHERCRRFAATRMSMPADEALRHVEGRAEDLAQARPEYNHATNAMCIVARRERTRGLFLDRRAFLNSYDPTQDDASFTILARILSAAVPVCAGISLEYYFSCVDSSGWGCGSKLPHNITSLLGVMEGAASDLRTGLSQQMIEIHEPVRLLFVIETTPAAMQSIMSANETIRRLIENGWVRLALLDPQSSQIQVYDEGRYRPYQPGRDALPQAKSSHDWYRGWRDHLGFAEIRPTGTEHSSSAEHVARREDNR